ncbi:hypothetical protein NDU88_003709 [Pleurodeles waltl]|uniref:Uncharacterized protein n=1 Tax=Pleurodeles waltl TaxID=8319 RepID=A0AAV7VI62_PLEWA|nr:hypothetical protein NDU88_003709 [Pleurodeles waltl]
MLSQLDQKGGLETHQGFQSQESRPRLGVREVRIPADCKRGIRQGYEPSSPEGAEAFGSSAGVGSGSPKMQLAPDPGVRRSGCAAGRRLEPGPRLGQILLPGAWGEAWANPVAWSLPKTRRASAPGVGGAAGRWLKPEARLRQMLPGACYRFRVDKVCFLPACKPKNG